MFEAKIRNFGLSFVVKTHLRLKTKYSHPLRHVVAERGFIEVVNLLNVEHERMYSSAFRSDEEATELNRLKPSSNRMLLWMKVRTKPINYSSSWR